MYEIRRDVGLLQKTPVLVVGGGSAGVAAAVMAARNGADVLLLERYNHLGGQATGGLVLLLDGYAEDEVTVCRGLGEEIADRLPNTIYLMSVTLVIVAIIAVPIGIISAVKQYSVFDIVVTTFSFMGKLSPSFGWAWS